MRLGIMLMMQNMTSFNFGDVLLVPFPFTDQTTAKKRPAVVISSQDYNQQRPDVILIAVTSRVLPVLQFGEVLINDWAAAGLLKVSVIKPIVTTLEKSLVLRRLGQLEARDLQALRSVLGVILAGIG